MTEEIDPNVRRCIIKKSKYYFRQELEVVVLLLIAAVVIIGIAGVLSWAGNNLVSLTAFLIVIMDFAIIGLVAWNIVEHYHEGNKLKRFLITFFKLHAVILAGLFIFMVEILCFLGIPACMFALGIIIGSWFTSNIEISLVIICIIEIFVIPVNFSIFVCLKIDPYINSLAQKLAGWI